MQYGIIDTHDDTWIGGNSGPILFDTEEFGDLAEGLAQVAAQTLEYRTYGTDLGGLFKVRSYPKLPVFLKCEVPTKMDSLTALRRLEGDD